MNGSWKNLFQHDGYRPAEIEHSILSRVLVLLTIIVAIMATVEATESAWTVPLLAIVATSMGSWVSWHRRQAKNWWIKIILALLMLVALASFLYEISDNPFDARLPLAHLLIWLQVLHSFDLPRRKDIFYSLWVALILISIAATISRDLAFGGFLIFYAIFTLASLMATHLSSQQVRGTETPPTKRVSWPRLAWADFSRVSLRIALPVVLLSLVGTAFLFVLMPRYDGMKIQSFPVSMQLKNLPVFKGEIKNKSYPSHQGNASGTDHNAKQKQQKRIFDPNAYYGFSTELDLNYRGHLADQVVMRVRSAKPSYWRGMAFDHYDGHRWSMTEPYKLKRLGHGHLPIWVRETQDLIKNIVPRERLIQTFYIEQDQSNLIFKAPYAEFLYFPTDYVMMDNYGSLRAPIELFRDTTYSVISEVPDFSAVKLREIDWEQLRQNPVAAAYYQVPETLPPRVETLAREITAKTQNPYDAVKALELYLKSHFPYNLDILEFPEDRDTVDYFLFEQKAGYCEHFASSLAVMARSLGVATRFVTGYTSGSYNPMTGYFDVHGSDAHGWVEAYFPHHGWVPFDATPGYMANLQEHQINQGVNAGQFWTYFARFVPASWKAFVTAAWQKSLQMLLKGFGLVSVVLTILPLRGLILIVAALIAVLLLAVFWRSQRRQAQDSAADFVPAYASEPQRQQFVQDYGQWLRELSLYLQRPWEPERTSEEQLRLLLPLLSLEQQGQLQDLNRLYYELRYAGIPLEPSGLQAARTQMQSLKTELSKLEMQVH